MRLRLRLSIIIASIVVSGCTQHSQPPRPPGVPSEAFWMGGSDGGVFLHLTRHDRPGAASYSGHVYHPDGSIWYEGRFTLEPASGPAVDPASKKQFAGWDGNKILLQDGRALVAGGAR